ncbi:IS66 family transposase, partial [Zunongwangia sp. F117]|nr:IS66 family transposase [Zunongwangia sp. F117]
MENDLENLSKDELLALLQKQDKSLQKEAKKLAKAEKATAKVIEENTQLKFQVEYYKRLAFGQKRERFEGDKDQMSLPFEMDSETAQKQEEEVKEKLTYERR